MPASPLQIPLGRLIYRGDAQAGCELVCDPLQGWRLREPVAAPRRARAEPLLEWLQRRRVGLLGLALAAVLALGLFALWRSFELQRQHGAALQALAQARQQAREPVDPVLLRALEPFRPSSAPVPPRPPSRTLPRETPSEGPVRRLRALGPLPARTSERGTAPAVLFELDPRSAAASASGSAVE